MNDKVTNKFFIVYGSIYNALYECDRNDELVDYGKLVDLADALVKRNEPYRELVRAHFERHADVPTSDRELAAFVMAAMGVSDIWDAIVEYESSVAMAEWMNGLMEGRTA